MRGWSVNEMIGGEEEECLRLHCFQINFSYARFSSEKELIVRGPDALSVSYTHLTLPTNREV